MQFINVFDYARVAQETLPQMVWDYFQGGSGDEQTMWANEHAFDLIQLYPHVLNDITTMTTNVTVQGAELAMPLLVAPMAFHSLVHDEGECATARATEQTGSLMIVSTFATRRLEEIAAATSGPLWFQMYVYRDLSLTESLLRRAEVAGYQALVLTVDAPVLGQRERDIRNNFSLSAGLRIMNFDDADQPDSYIPRPTAITWQTVSWLRTKTKLPLLLKGILRADDALLALEHGADGIIVSNHGGRQLDGAISSIDALPAVVDAVAGRCEVYMDSGIRRGTHIFKALALGARAVLVGRPIIWGLASAGEKGVQQVIHLLHEELLNTMALTGCSSLAHIDHSLVHVSPRMDVIRTSRQSRTRFV